VIVRTGRIKSIVLIATLALLCFTFLLVAPILVRATTASTATSTVTVSPTSGIVGTKIGVSGQGFPPNTSLVLNWGTDNVSWVLGGNPTEVTGIKAVSWQEKLASVQTNSSGSFFVTVNVPTDDGGKHVIQVYSANDTAFQGLAVFTLEPSFSTSVSSGPAGTPIVVAAHGLGDGVYSTNYHIMWDNKYFGYMTAATTRGEANFTLYAVGEMGVHYIDIYQGSPGPGYLNPDQNPSPGNWYPPYLPYQTTFTITSEPFTSSGGDVSSNYSSIILPILFVGLVIAAFTLTPLVAFRNDKNKRSVLSRGVGKLVIIIVVAGLLIAGSAILLIYANQSTGGSNSSKTVANYVPQVVVVRPQITVPTSNATSGPRISVNPNLATVGTIVNVTGSGFAPNSPLPVSWSTFLKTGTYSTNLTGYSSVVGPLRNVTSNAAGSFSFDMKVPVDLEGDHFISVANQTPNSYATLYIERNATITPSEGPEGTPIIIQLVGTGWDWNTNIVAIDYDNAFVGYACGFNSEGNITVTIPAAGSPGIHTVDLYPSIYLGPPPPSAIPVYRYPLVTPYDHPEKVPSFHFSFLITSGNQTTSNGSAMGSFSVIAPALGFASIGLVSLSLVSLAPRIFRKFPRFLIELGAWQ
jgi:hypothetical protein